MVTAVLEIDQCLTKVLFLSCLCRFCDSNLHKTCTGIKKTKKTKPLDAQNLHRHQKNQKTKVWASTQGWGSKDCKILVILFFLMPVQVLSKHALVFLFFWCLCRFCDSNLHKTCTGIKKTKKNKPLDAQNLHRHQKNQKKTKSEHLLRAGVYRLQNFGDFVFFDACACFVKVCRD